MKPFDHPLARKSNIIELVIQSPFWVFAYATGFVFFLEVFAWVAYGLGLHIHPNKYPLPHSMLLDFLAELMRWLTTNVSFPTGFRFIIGFLFATLLLLGTPLIFITYAKYIYGFWFGGHPFDVLQGFS